MDSSYVFQRSRSRSQRDSHEAEVLAVLDAVRIFPSFQDNLIMESGPFNAITSVSQEGTRPLKLQFCFNEIKAFISQLLLGGGGFAFCNSF